MKNKLINILYFALSAILLTVIQQPYNLSFFAWVAFVPFVLGSLNKKRFLDSARNDSHVIVASYIVGVIYWLANLYWLFPITIAGWAAACLYFAVYWPLVVIALRFCTERNIPLWFSLPILIVGEESLRGWLFGWRFLAHSQSSNIALIQIADIFGTAGVSFVIAMVNGVICDIILNYKNIAQRKNIITGGLITTLILVSVIFYGRHRINQTPDYTEPGPKIGIVQSNVPVKAGEDTEPFEKIFIDQLADSRKAFAQAQPALIIWPETMVETVLHESYLKLVGEGYMSKEIHKALVRHASEGVYILVGAFAADAVQDGNNIKFNKRYNTAFLYEPNQPWAYQHYNKIQLVPFGEYIPLKKELPFLYKFLLSMTPYDYDYTLDRGTEYTNFKMSAGNKKYTFATSICFEDTIPSACRKLIAEDGIKQADWLVNISNDGWFVQKTGAKIQVSTELRQRMAICVFRAIENRVPIIRCANTGISCMIDSLGNIKNGYISGTLNQNAAKRTAQSGWLVDSVKIDKRGTIFSKHKQILALICAMCLILSAVMSIYNLIENRKMKVENND